MSKKTQFQMTISAEDKASSAFQKVAKSSKSLGNDLGALDKLFTNFGSGFDPSSITAAIGGVLGGISLSSSLQEFSGFQRALWNTTKVTDESTESIRQKIMELPAELGSATELTTGYYQVISAGITDTAKSMDTLIVASQTAKGAEIEQSVAVNALAKVMNAYGDEIKDATTASNMFFSIEKLGMTNVRELAPLMGELSGVAKSLGVEYFELAGSMALVTQTSGSASQASTQLRSLMLELQKPAKNLQAAFDAVGIKSFAALVQTEGWPNALKKLQEGAEKSGQSLAEMFGSQETFLGFNALLKNNFSLLKDYSDEVKNAHDGLANATSGYLEILDGKFATTQSHLTNLGIRAGESFGGVASSSLDTFNSSLGYLTTNFETAKDSAVIFGTALTALIATKKLAGIQLGTLGAQYTTFNGVTMQTASSMTRIGTLARGVGASLLSAFGGPVGLAVTALGGGMAYLATRESEAERAARLLADANKALDGSFRDVELATDKYITKLTASQKLTREIALDKSTDALTAQWERVTESLNSYVKSQTESIYVGRGMGAQMLEQNEELQGAVDSVFALKKEYEQGAITGDQFNNKLAELVSTLEAGSPQAKGFADILKNLIHEKVFSEIDALQGRVLGLLNTLSGYDGLLAREAGMDAAAQRAQALLNQPPVTQRRIPTGGSGGSGGTDKTKQKAEEAKRAIEDLNDEIAKLTMSDAAYREFELTNKLEELQEKIPGNIALIKEFELAQRAAWVKEDAEESSKHLDVQLSFYQDLIDRGGEYAGLINLQTKAIEKQSEAWLKAGIPQEYINQMEYLQQLEVRTDWMAGVERGFRSLERDATDMASVMEGAVTSAADIMSSSLADFVLEGKGNFTDLVNSILQDWARMAIQMASNLLIQQIFTGIGGLFGGFGGGASSGIMGGFASGGSAILGAFHGGGIAGGTPTFDRAVPISFFDNAPRFHDGGIAGNEVPAVLQRGEGIFTPEQMRHLAPVGSLSNVVTVQPVITIENYGSDEVSTQTSTDNMGNPNIRVMIGDIAASQMTSPGTNANKILRQATGSKTVKQR